MSKQFTIILNNGTDNATSYPFSYTTVADLAPLFEQFKNHINGTPLDKQLAIADELKKALNAKIKDIVLADIAGGNIVAELLKQRTIPLVKAGKDKKGGLVPVMEYKPQGKEKKDSNKHKCSIFVTYADIAQWAEKNDKKLDLFNISQLEYFRRFGGNVWNIANIGEKVTVSTAPDKALEFFNSTADADIKKQLGYCFDLISNSAKLDKPLFATKGRVEEFKYFAVNANIFTFEIAMFGNSEIDIISLLIAYASQLAKDKEVATRCGLAKPQEEPQQAEQPQTDSAPQPQQETPKAPQQAKKGGKK